MVPLVGDRHGRRRCAPAPRPTAWPTTASSHLSLPAVERWRPLTRLIDEHRTAGPRCRPRDRQGWRRQDHCRRHHRRRARTPRPPRAPLDHRPSGTSPHSPRPTCRAHHPAHRSDSGDPRLRPADGPKGAKADSTPEHLELLAEDLRSRAPTGRRLPGLLALLAEWQATLRRHRHRTHRTHPAPARRHRRLPPHIVRRCRPALPLCHPADAPAGPRLQQVLIVTLAETTPVVEATELQDDLGAPGSSRSAGWSTPRSAAPAPQTPCSAPGLRSNTRSSPASPRSRHACGRCPGVQHSNATENTSCDSAREMPTDRPPDDAPTRCRPHEAAHHLSVARQSDGTPERQCHWATSSGPTSRRLSLAASVVERAQRDPERSGDGGARVALATTTASAGTVVARRGRSGRRCRRVVEARDQQLDGFGLQSPQVVDVRRVRHHHLRARVRSGSASCLAVCGGVEMSRAPLTSSDSTSQVRRCRSSSATVVAGQVGPPAKNNSDKGEPSTASGGSSHGR